MSRKRKTVDVEWLRTHINRINADSTCDAKIREGWNALLGSVLHHTGNYNGFTYLTTKDIPIGQEPGMVYHENTRLHTFPDETRRYYY
jgi:hypothetical protein